MTPQDIVSDHRPLRLSEAERTYLHNPIDPDEFPFDDDDDDDLVPIDPEWELPLWSDETVILPIDLNSTQDLDDLRHLARDWRAPQ